MKSGSVAVRVTFTFFTSSGSKVNLLGSTANSPFFLASNPKAIDPATLPSFLNSMISVLEVLIGINLKLTRGSN